MDSAAVDTKKRDQRKEHNKNKGYHGHHKNKDKDRKDRDRERVSANTHAMRETHFLAQRKSIYL